MFVLREFYRRVWSALGIEEELSPNTFTSPPILAHMWTLCFRRGVEQVWPAYLFWNSFTNMLKPGAWSLMYSILHKNVRDEGTVSVFLASFSFFPELHIHAIPKIHVLVWILARWGNWVWKLWELQSPEAIEFDNNTKLSICWTTKVIKSSPPSSIPIRKTKWILPSFQPYLYQGHCGLIIFKL